MTLVAVTTVAGSRGATTTATALALTWPGEVLLADLDPSGGDIGAWFDLPASPDVASAVASSAGEWPLIATHTQIISLGVRVLAAPLRSREADIAVGEATRRIVPVLSAHPDAHVIADTGRSGTGLSPVAAQAAMVVIVAQQVAGSTRATAAMLERVHDLARLCAARSMPVHVAVIGDDPYPLREIAIHLGQPCHLIVDDPLGAAVLAGRPATGRLATRSRLLKSAGRLASIVHDDLMSVSAR